jgi:hypothetical protein
MVSNWYFARDPNVDNPSPLCQSWRKVCKYHLGSICFGSFIVALVRFIRYCLLMVKKNMKQTNKFVKMIWCVIEYCLKCLERFLDFISKNAYIQIMIRGSSFCTGAKDSFLLLAANVLRLAAVQVIGDAFLFLGKFFVMVSTGGIAFIIAGEAYGEDLNSPVPVGLMGMLIGWMIGSSFMGVYESCIDTIFQCFCIDDQNANDDSNHQMYAGPGLQAFIKDNESKGGESAQSV